MTLKIRPKDPKSQKSKIIEILRGGGIGVMPTDTIYGLVGRALDEKAVERIYVVRKRTPSKPMIILISAVDDLNLLSVKSVSFATPFAARRREKSKFSAENYASRANDTDFTREKLNKLWPGKVSVVLPCHDEKFYYLHRGSKSLAFRLPNDEYLRDLISQTGPLVAPSANLEGMPPATTIDAAEKYFGDKVDFYLDGGKAESSPSKLIKIEGDKIIELRK